MSNDFIYAMLAADRIRELHAEADNDRLVRIAQADRPSWVARLRALAGGRAAAASARPAVAAG